ncbi:phage scaffolding protein [Butyricicoccus pullicaecorum]|uniref:Phage minor structural protein GP20 n=1 Tax=Butyricicoccus pullicaecorum 1.2 TaxID=1203606 RepID=R8W3W5_9FIRM|nr:phage scaffolding protein [Butyricicoccus pullicaecorum]EOQ39630.1 hypothetical protein HMPREF1526_00324 [Butyricicoccus pullicaecorum 1.2]SKA56846.1 Phage minor structural protein GP20 [Butyricicoccus pullicaecorum DSM 23266]
MNDWIKEIIGDSYTDEMDGKVTAALTERFVGKADYDLMAGQLATAQATLSERDSQLETLRQTKGDADALRQQISQLQAQNTQKDEQHQAEIAKMRLDAAVEHELLAARAKNTTAAKALLASFLKDAKVEEDGTVKGLADQVSRLRTGADTAFLFEAQTAPRISGAVPAGSTAGADPRTMDYATRLADARKSGNNAQAVAILNAAARDGVNLM